MFAFVSAFPKSLHCTNEAQQAETVLSAVLSIYMYIYSGLKGTVWDGDLATVLDWRGLSTTRL